MTLQLSLIVLGLIPNLCDDEFAVRVSAQRSIEQLLPHGLPWVVTFTESEDPEIARRCKTIIDRYCDVRPTSGQIPWVDCLPANWTDREGIIREHLNAVRTPATYGYHDGWPEYRAAMAHYARELLLVDGWSRRRVIRLLDVMADEERAYGSRNGMMAARLP